MITSKALIELCRVERARHEGKVALFRMLEEWLASQGGVVDHNPDVLYEEISCMIPEESEKALQELADEAQAMGLYGVADPEVTSTCGDVQLEFDFMKEKESE